MNVQYRQTFLKDLKRLKNQPIYQAAYDLAFTTLPQVETLREVPGVKALKGKRYRVRLGDYRVGLEVDGDDAQVMRVLHRREFYRYFP